jgi:hypothetical protein
LGKGDQMTVPGFGRLTPVQGYMLQLAGINLDRHRYGFDPFKPGAEEISDLDRIEIMKRGRTALVKYTHQDFGFDLEAWQSFLMANPDFGFTHPYGYRVTKKHIQTAIAVHDRRMRWARSRQLINKRHRTLDS